MKSLPSMAHLIDCSYVVPQCHANKSSRRPSSTSPGLVFRRMMAAVVQSMSVGSHATLILRSAAPYKERSFLNEWSGGPLNVVYALSSHKL